MNCPNCAAPIVDDQQFCRSCGTGLPDDGPRLPRPQVWGMVALAMTFGGLLVAITGSMIDLRWLIFTGVFIVITGMFLIAALSLLGQTRPRKRGRQQSRQPRSIAPAVTTNKLLPLGQNDFIPSVTEKTTNLLIETGPDRNTDLHS